MKLSARFARAVEALPAMVKERLDADAAIDWAGLTDRSVGVEIENAGRRYARLPHSVETLIARLVAEVGIAPEDVATGTEGRGVAGRWLHEIVVEPDGEWYRLRHRQSGELLTGVRPEALAGYAVLGMELAEAVQRASQAWRQAGLRTRATPMPGGDALTRCTAQMRLGLREIPETADAPVPTAALARSLEDSWNAQSFVTRETLALYDFAYPGGARPPRAKYYAAATGYRLHVFDIGEARWLLALAEHARSIVGAAGTPKETERNRSQPQRVLIMTGSAHSPALPPSDLPDGHELGSFPGEPAGDGAAMAHGQDPLSGAAEAVVPGVPEASPAPDHPWARQRAGVRTGGARGIVGCGERCRSFSRGSCRSGPIVGHQRVAGDGGGRCRLGARPPGGRRWRRDLAVRCRGETALAPGRNGLADPGRSAGAGGAGAATGRGPGRRYNPVAGRLQDPDGLRSLRDTLGMEPPGDDVPPWVEELATKLLLDTGAETRDGLRTGPAQLAPERLAHGERRVIDAATSEWGVFRAVDVVEQLRLSLTFASDAWSATTLLADAGKEAEWALRDAAVKQARLSRAERTRLDAAQRIGEELRRLRRARSGESSTAPTALEETALIASALKSLQPSERAGAGWPEETGLPNPRHPGDVARLAAAADALHHDIRAIANRLVTAWVTGGDSDR